MEKIKKESKVLYPYGCKCYVNIFFSSCLLKLLECIHYQNFKISINIDKNRLACHNT